ncbi:sigma-70 family RNA polymerase sigma factor (plasmid) [Streptomyces sp. NBC_00536]|uniref:sigma-70 family RNA polymerase sigma factor n=1 Tax=Streptomyces sp. NBC_00536 TaxID=2975769 RepID=UPI002E80DA30|nr:sigma-70 family RNA polymerase sigma factor [Streptomyces sp. NBC_00536]WUC84092.1 sigma-70 family RNA polymerase sigma factor [Streptomyces sp. NBC_00536]
MPFESQVPAPQPAHARPGRKLGPIADTVGSSHRAWLEHARDSYLASGLTLNELGLRVLLAKSKLSELLRGLGRYPRWEVIHRLSVELKMPVSPLYRLWRQAALDAQKTYEWVQRSSDKAALATPHSHPPVAHEPFRRTVEGDYRRYAQAFLTDASRDAAVDDTFDILWLSWNSALASPDIRRYAWKILRATVMAKTPHLDGRPELGSAVFDTVAISRLTGLAERAEQMTESLCLFRAIGRLPDNLQDVMVLRHLCGNTVEKTSALLGVPPPTVRSDERHAVRVIFPPPESEGPIE